MVKSSWPVWMLVFGLSACVKQAPAPPQVLAGESEHMAYATARSSWLEARTLAVATAADAQLTLIEGRWVEAGGLSRNWRFSFYSLAQGKQLVIESGQLILHSGLAQAPKLLSTADWRFDSDAALTRFGLVQQIRFPVTSMRLDAGLVWQISGPSGQGEVPAG